MLVGLGLIGLYLAAAYLQDGLGFPLDDGWIHQTYARNLGRNGRLEYVPGIVSAGSTSPLWTVLLAIGYFLRLPFLAWVYLLGTTSLLWLAWGMMRLWRQLWPDYAAKEWIVGLVIVGSWPLLWAAVSGMETVFFIGLGATIVTLYFETTSFSSLFRIGWLGFLSGLLILTRPDGLLLLLLIGGGLILLSGSMNGRLQRIGLFVGTAVIPLIPYFLFNYATSGTVWPNTLYAKQAEYQLLLTQPFIKRFSQLLFFSLGGPESGWRGMSTPHLLLLPGLLIAAWHGIRQDVTQRRLYRLLPLLWAGGHILLYAWRLPLTFQHGRYLLPALPIWSLFGLAGWQSLLSFGSKSRPTWIIKQVGRFTFGGLFVIFLLLGARAYATDVAFINNEMVDVAHWLAENAPKDALIATHDIGAIGYFAERPLLDLAGLISPEIIPYIDNEPLLADFLKNHNVAYLVTAPGWPYENVVSRLGLMTVYRTNYSWTQESGKNNMTIYLLSTP